MVDMWIGLMGFVPRLTGGRRIPVSRQSVSLRLIGSVLCFSLSLSLSVVMGDKGEKNSEASLEKDADEKTVVDASLETAAAEKKKRERLQVPQRTTTPFLSLTVSTIIDCRGTFSRQPRQVTFAWPARLLTCLSGRSRWLVGRKMDAVGWHVPVRLAGASRMVVEREGG